LRRPVVLGIVLLCAPACFLQKLDENAAKGDPNANKGPALDTPPIDLPGGGSTNDPCARTIAQATDILRTNCASCHGGGQPGARQGQPPFDFVLDFARMTMTRSATVPDPHSPSQGMLFIVPGDPDASRVYQRIVHGEMPPMLPVGLDPLPRPSISDISLLNYWITSCMGASPPAPSPVDAGATDGAPAAGDGGEDDGGR
jgi:hypothetical protein